MPNIRIGEIQVRLSGDPTIAQEFATIYSRYPGLDPRHPTISMNVRKHRPSFWGNSLYSITGDAVSIGPDRVRSEAIPALEWAINARVIATRNDFVLLHAASLVHPSGGGIVLAGASGCGKSTLAMGLLARGWSYLCDEFALVRPQTGCLHPFPKALCIKAGSFHLARDLKLGLSGRSYYVKGLKGPVGYINPITSHARIGRPALVRLIVFPRFAGEAEPRASALSTSKAMFGLIGALLNSGAVGPGAADILFRLAAGAACFSLRSGSLPQTCDLLERLMTESMNLSATA
jgi:hypothetical protein